MCTSNHPYVSVLVPVYNAAPFIAATIQAVLAQTFENFELILLDDASTDNSAEIIKKFTDPRITFVQNKHNLGISASRNKLASLARGKYVAVLDHDDLCLPQRLETQVNFLDTHPEIAMVGSWFELFCPPEASFVRRLIVNLGWIWCQPEFPTLQDAWRGNVLMHSTAMYRRTSFAAHGLCYDPACSPAEDYDLVRQALAAGLRLANIPQVLLRYNFYGGNFSLRAKARMRHADRLVKNRIAALLYPQPRRRYPYWLVMLEKLRLKFMIAKRKDNV